MMVLRHITPVRTSKVQSGRAATVCRRRIGFRTELGLWSVAGLLLLPIYLVYLANLTNTVGGTGTGFLHYDAPQYMAYARAYFSKGYFTLSYGLPFSPDPDTPRIYFQPTTLLLGILLKATRGDPGLLFATAGIIFALLCARIIIALSDEVVPCAGPVRWLMLLCLFWGGGLFTIAGATHSLLLGKLPRADDLLYFDPVHGLWCLNLGRNLIYTLEAWYHMLFLGGIVFVLRQRYLWALVCAVLLSASHPYSGLQFLVVLGIWSVAEWVTKRPDRPPLYFPVVVGALGILHLGYYMWFLGFVSPEFRSVQQQVALPEWVVPTSTMMCAYAFVGALAAIALFDAWRRGRWPSWHQRLFLVWFFVSLTLMKLSPIEPLHFTRGYDWTPLFLLGAPVLATMFTKGLRKWAGQVLLSFVVGLFLLDNTFWFLLVGVREHDGRYGWKLDGSERAVLEEFNDPRVNGYLVVSQSARLGYLATAYSPLRSWYSHNLVTPFAALRQEELTRFFAEGTEPIQWQSRSLLAVVMEDEAAATQLKSAGFSTLLTNGPFTVLARDSGAAWARACRRGRKNLPRRGGWFLPFPC
jgi:hypothetical protein